MYSYNDSFLEDNNFRNRKQSYSVVSTNKGLKQLVPVILNPLETNLGQSYHSEAPVKRNNIDVMIDEITKKYFRKDENKVGNGLVRHKHSKSGIAKKKNIDNSKRKIRVKKRNSVLEVKENKREFSHGCKSRKKQNMKIEYGKLLEILQRHIKVCPKLARELDEALIM